MLLTYHLAFKVQAAQNIVLKFGCLEMKTYISANMLQGHSSHQNLHRKIPPDTIRGTNPTNLHLQAIMSTDPSSYTSFPNPPEESTSDSESSNPPSSICHFSAHVLSFEPVTLEPIRGDFTMLISTSCAAFASIDMEARRIVNTGLPGEVIRMSFDTAPETFGKLDVIPRGSAAYAENEEAPSQSRVERQMAAASGQSMGALRRLTVLNGESEPSQQSQGSGQGRSDGKA